MDQTKKKKITFVIIGATIFLIGLITFIVGCVIKRPVVTFVNYDDTVLYKAPTAIGKTAVYAGETPTKKSDQSGYTYVFVGWEQSIDNIRENKTVKAVYEKRVINYNLNYVLNGGSVTEDLVTRYTVEQTVSLPTPTRMYCTFGGWYTTEKYVGNPITSISKGNFGDKTLYAKWNAPSYEITYELNGGTCNNLQNTYTPIEEVELPKPTKGEMVFGGWYTTPNFDEETKVSVIKEGTMVGELNLYAKWLYNVNYELNGGVLAKNVIKTYEERNGMTLPVPTKTGYEFMGWFVDEALEQQLTEIAPGTTGDVTLYAKWQLRPEGQVFEENNIKYIYFGHYVQSVVTERSIIDELKKLETPASNTYEYNGEKFIKVKVPSKKIYRFDHYVELKDGKFDDIIDKETYYFKVEPIKWRVLEEKDGKLFLLSEYILDYESFDVTSNNYENSSIRKWLNETFLNDAFNETEQARILTTEVKNTATSTSNSNNKYACNNTQDKVFLLSYEEVINLDYGFKSDYKASDSAKAAVTTDYTRALGIDITGAYANYGQSSWMLRSPFTEAKSISIIKGIKSSSTSPINYIEKFASSTIKYGVRPAMVIEA